MRAVPPDDDGPRLSRPGALSRDELVALVQRILDGDDAEDEQDRLVRTFEQSVVHPGASDLIYWPERRADGSWPEPTADEIVDAALAYKPIELGS